MTVWMAVSRDQYQLPIAVADTAEELGRLVGVKPASIETVVSRFNTGKIRNLKRQNYFKVEIEEDDHET
jgi:ribosomal protein L7Ae-like RNA K-turn-binding protein